MPKVSGIIDSRHSSASQTPRAAMRDYIASRYDQFLHDLETLVNIDSPSSSPEGLRRVAAYLKDRFQKMGWDVQLKELDKGTVPCLEAVNSAAGAAGRKFDFLFVGHLDTVFPKGTAAQRPFRTSGGRATGPGTNDMKAGLLTALHALEAITHFGLSEKLSLAVAFNADEEIGSKASRAWIDALARQSQRVFVFEPCRPGWNRVLKRKGGGVFHVTCRGKAAHAGVEPEKGANAVVELAHQVLQITGFSRPESGTTVNATVICGGGADNVIPELASATIDVRVAEASEAERIDACFSALPGQVHVQGVEITVSGGIERPPMVPSPETMRLWEKMETIAGEVGISAGWISTGGGSDGNFTAALGVPTVDGMGPIGGGSHSLEEYVDLDSVVPAVHFVCRLLQACVEGKLNPQERMITRIRESGETV